MTNAPFAVSYGTYGKINKQQQNQLLRCLSSLDTNSARPTAQEFRVRVRELLLDPTNTLNDGIFLFQESDATALYGT